MHPVISNNFREYLVWLLGLAIIIVGGRYAKQFIEFVLDKLYQVFIQNNPTAV